MATNDDGEDRTTCFLSIPDSAQVSRVDGNSSDTSQSLGPSFWPANAIAATCVKPKKKRRRDRNRPIHEINRLQLQVKELETQLKSLKPQESPELQQLKKKNENVKAKVEKNIEKTKAVAQLLQTQADKLLQAFPKSLSVSGENLVYDVVQDDAVYQVLARTIDGHYLDMDRVLGDAGVLDATSEIFDARVSQPTLADTDCVLKTRTCAFLPYAMERVETAMWRRLECESAILPENIKSSKQLGLPLGNASNLIVSKREVHLGDTSFTIRLALKEFVDPTRLVYVWDAIGDWPQENTSLHVSTREYGWSVFSPTDSADLSVLRSLVLVRSNTTPTVDVNLLERVMQLYRYTIEARYQKLENTLVDASICPKKAPCVAESKGKNTCCCRDYRDEALH
ncbi:hypothetical protein PHPALM_28003 [Phytophthora palmivora]|uniref:M96 mating-specific protein family n=1 Tax=Phytophthora palmivora TaxID=4796 RepID=A0A2P4XB59_9STRA|nr:hypothetical protein PHPALM_28003 [Phytophthora palmivora]